MSKIKKLDKLSKERLLFGNWEYDATDDSLIDYDAIVSLFDKKGIEGNKYISCDVARFGSDKSVVMLFNGLNVELIKTFDKNTITELADYIKDLQQQHQVPLRNIICDTDGVGSGVTDILRCQSFVNNAKPLRKENYQNLKTQCFYTLAKKINEGQIGIDCPDISIKECIIEELEQVRAKNQDKDARLQIIPKDTIKALIGRSPDYADALAMRMYYEIKPSGKYYVQ